MSSDKSTTEKLRVLLPHWIEHNNSHKAEYKKWAALAREEGHREVADCIEAAIGALETVDRSLSEALDRVGGAAAGGEHHHHHHHHHHS